MKLPWLSALLSPLGPAVFVAGFMAIASPVYSAQTAAELTVTAVRLQPGESIKLDGTLSHPAWQRAPVHDRAASAPGLGTFCGSFLGRPCGWFRGRRKPRLQRADSG